MKKLRAFLTTMADLATGYRIINRTAVGGCKNGKWAVDKDTWITVVWAKERGDLPKPAGNGLRERRGDHARGMWGMDRTGRVWYHGGDPREIWKGDDTIDVYKRQALYWGFYNWWRWPRPKLPKYLTLSLEQT